MRKRKRRKDTASYTLLLMVVWVKPVRYNWTAAYYITDWLTHRPTERQTSRRTPNRSLQSEAVLLIGQEDGREDGRPWGGGGNKKSWDQTKNRVFALVTTRQAKHFYRKRNDPGGRSGADWGRKLEVVELSLGGSFGHESNALVSWTLFTTSESKNFKTNLIMAIDFSVPHHY